MKTFLTIFCLLYAVEAHLFANKTKLHKDLFTNYEKAFQPNENQIKPTEISIISYMRSLHEPMGEKGEIGVVGSLVVEWKDVRLVWNPSDYGGDLNQTSVFVDDIWTPYLVIMNPYKKINPILPGELSCKVWYNGYISCIPPPNFFEAMCDADVRFYPYDTQVCTLQLYIPGYFSSDLKFQPASPTINKEMYEEDEVWSLDGNRIFVHTQHINDKSVETLKIEIKLQRKWRYQIIKISPIFLLDFLQIFVFYLHHDSGERVTFSVTVLLTEVVFLTLIQEELPEDSVPDISYLVYKQLADMVASFFVMIAILQAGIFYNKGKREQTKESVEKLRKTNWTDIGRAFDYLCLLVFFIVFISINLIFYLKMDARNSF